MFLIILSLNVLASSYGGYAYGSAAYGIGYVPASPEVQVGGGGSSGVIGSGGGGGGASNVTNCGIIEDLVFNTVTGIYECKSKISSALNVSDTKINEVKDLIFNDPIVRDAIKGLGGDIDLGGYNYPLWVWVIVVILVISIILWVIFSFVNSAISPVWVVLIALIIGVFVWLGVVGSNML